MSHHAEPSSPAVGTHDVHPGDGTIESVSPFELFFDLVFVYAFTQVTSLLADDPTWHGLTRGLLVFAALWWAWVGYAWLATTTSLEEGFLRIVTIGVMCTMLVVGVATPGAFGEHALAFAVSWGIVRLMHVGIYAWAVRGRPRLRRNVLGLLPGACIGTALLTAAAFQEGQTATMLWALALLIDYMGPLLIDSSGWEVSASHFAERFGLIFIIALGESLIALGIGASDLPINFNFIVLCSLGVITISTLWWTYFDVVAIAAERRLVHAHGAERGQLARDSYTYLHLPMIAGVILYALGVKKALGHPEDSLKAVPATALVGGIVLYLVAHVLFRLRNVRSLNRPRLVVSALLVALLVAGGTRLSAGWLVTLVAAAMIALVAYESVRYREARARIRSGAWQPPGAIAPPPAADTGR